MSAGLPSWFTHAPEIMGVYIRHYKNLRDVWLRWDSKMVLLGANGVGKTNVLECCALLMGTDETKRLVARRVPRDLEFDISVVLSGDRLVVPLEDLLAIKQWQGRWPGAAEDEDWLMAVGAREGESLSESVSFAAQVLGANAQQLDAISLAMGEGTVRWRLQSETGERTWSRTLVTRDRPERLVAAARDEMPWPLRPLLSDWTDKVPKGHDPFLDLLLLPARSDVPVDLQWLPYLRSSSEIAQDFTDAIYAAAPALGVYQIGAGLEAMLLGLAIDLVEAREQPVESTAWVVGLAEEMAQHQLALTLPDLPPVKLSRTEAPLDHETVVGAFASGELDLPEEGFEDGPNTWNADRTECLVSVSVGNDPVIGTIDEQSLEEESSLVDVLSAGERRWFDEAMHAAATAIRERGRLAALDTSRLYALWQGGDEIRIDRDILTAALRAAWDEDERWTAHAITGFLQSLAEPMQRVSHSAVLAQALANLRVIDEGSAALEEKKRLRLMVLGVIWDELARTNAARAKVRVFDEPEAHLHSGAVGRVADALRELAGGADVLVSSHHPRFVYSAGWAPYHLRRNLPEHRTVLGVLDPTLRSARAHVADDLGISRAETLAGARALLLVEGDHDLRVLRAEPFGTQLRQAGVIVVPLRGAYELRSVALVEVLAELAPKIVGVMIDNGVIQARHKASTELQSLQQFHDLGSSKGLVVTEVLLSRPDITAYLNPEAVGVHNGSRKVAWSEIVEDYRDSRMSQFKDWLHESHHIDLRYGAKIDVVLRTMQARELPFESELVRAISTFIAHVLA